jgi:hypothetical protein
MIAISAQTKLYLARDATDMRKSFRGLILLTEAVLQQEPVSGHLFVFLNRRQDLMKILYWDGTGFCIWYKKQETECHRNLVFTESRGSPHNSGASAVGAGRMVSQSSEPDPRRRPMPYDTEVPVPPRAQLRRKRWRSINSGSG